MHTDLLRLAVVALLWAGLIATSGLAQTDSAAADPSTSAPPVADPGEAATPGGWSTDAEAPADGTTTGMGAANESAQAPPWAAPTRAAPQGAVVVLLGLLIVSAVIGWVLVGRPPASVRPMSDQALAESARLPVGLVIFAVLHFLFGGVTLLVVAGQLLEMTTGRGSLYAFASPLITAALFLVSGVGFVLRHRRAGLLVGIVLSIFSFANVLYWIVALGGVNILPLVYPVILFLFLYFKYRPEFYRNRSAGGAPTPVAA